MKDGFDGLVAAFKDEAIAKAAREEAAKANANTSNGDNVSTPTTTTATTANSGGDSGSNSSPGGVTKKTWHMEYTTRTFDSEEAAKQYRAQMVST